MIFSQCYLDMIRTLFSQQVVVLIVYSCILTDTEMFADFYSDLLHQS